MKRILVCLLAFGGSVSLKASDKDSTVYYNLPDSVKVVQFMAEISIQNTGSKKEVFAGIKTDIVSLSLESDKNEKEIKFGFPKNAEVKSTGIGIDADDKDELEWDYNWSVNETYRLLIATASDSAGNFSLYSGYIFLPKENKWKLIGTCKVPGRWNTIQNPAIFFSSGKKGMQITTGQSFIQRSNGSWKSLKEETLAPPAINLFGHIDSVQQRQIDLQKIRNSNAVGKITVTDSVDGVYYSILKNGSGRQVSINDTVTVFYKGYLFDNEEIFDQTRDKPATFPLKRLIRGWQIGVPLCKVGGKIKLIIPSDLAYSIRTRAAKIPPNSILVFEVEVVDAKPPSEF